MELGLNFEQDAEYPNIQTPLTSQSNYTLDLTNQPIKVILRIRPFSPAELARTDPLALSQTSPTTLLTTSSTSQTHLKFDQVLSPHSSQSDVYSAAGVDGLIGKAVEGYSVCVFAYGMTSSGKSWSITGPGGGRGGIDPYAEDVGVVPRAVLELQERLQRSREMYPQEGDTPAQFTMSMKASYYEIYNESVKDLLRPANTSLPVRWSVETGFFVENLFMVDCEVLDDFMVVLEEGLKNRKTGAHNLNSHSSRSHSIMTIYISTIDLATLDAKGMPVERVGSISFIDLAGKLHTSQLTKGSEKVKETKTTGVSLTETMNINKSLLTLGILTQPFLILGICIAALSDPHKKPHIPFRDSLLTKIMYDALGGNGYVLMIACVSPSLHCIAETMSTLRYAQRAGHVKAIPVIKTSDPQEEVITGLRRELGVARREIMRVREVIGGERWEGIVGREVSGRTLGRDVSGRNARDSHPHSHHTSDLFMHDYSPSLAQAYYQPQGDQGYEGGYQEYPASRHQSQDFSDYSFSENRGQTGLNTATKFSSDDSFYAYAHPKGKGKLATEQRKKPSIFADTNTKTVKAKR